MAIKFWVYSATYPTERLNEHYPVLNEYCFEFIDLIDHHGRVWRYAVITLEDSLRGLFDLMKSLGNAVVLDRLDAGQLFTDYGIQYELSIYDGNIE